MTITTSKGKTFDINWMWITNRGGNRIMIELEDSRSMADIAADFESVDTITKTDRKAQGVKEVYEGFTTLVIMSRDNADGVVRLTLEKGDAE